MLYWELIKETFLRKRLICIAHFSILIFYILLFALPLPANLKWCDIIFTLSGILLPMIITIGIFGDDITSGRIDFLVTKPVSLSKIYLIRLAGIFLQGFLHISIAGFSIWLMHFFFESKGTLSKFGIYLLASFLLFITIASLSTALSVAVKRGFNSAILILTFFCLFYITNILKAILPEHLITATICNTVKFILPPMQLLTAMTRIQNPAILMGTILHVMGLISTYTLLGLMLLRVKEYRRDID